MSGALVGVALLVVLSGALVLGAGRREPVPAPDRIPPIAGIATVQAPESAPVPARVPVADLFFEGDALESCDELSWPPSELHRLDAAKPAVGEVVRRGETCQQATSSKPWQATCTRPNGLMSYYYRASDVQGTDKLMRACLAEEGTWSRNEATTAKREALEQTVARGTRALAKIRGD